VYDPIILQGAGTVDALEVDVSITHAYVGDLRLQLVAPSGRSALLQAESDDASSDLERTYDVGNAPALATLLGETAAGEWRLEVADVGEDDAGTLNAWSLRVQAS
jgi:subtilisin-like proprotein convertase family protein